MLISFDLVYSYHWSDLIIVILENLGINQSLRNKDLNINSSFDTVLF